MKVTVTFALPEGAAPEAFESWVGSNPFTGGHHNIVWGEIDVPQLPVTPPHIGEVSAQAGNVESGAANDGGEASKSSDDGHTNSAQANDPQAHGFSARAVAYKKRNVVERAFCRLKHCRRIATRYDRKALYFMAFLHLAAAHIWG